MCPYLKRLGLLQRDKVPEPDGGQRDEGVVERVEERPALLRVVHQRAADRHEVGGDPGGDDEVELGGLGARAAPPGAALADQHRVELVHALA